MESANRRDDGAQAPGGKAEYVQPQTNTEIRLAQIWSQVLDIPKIGAEDNFFDLGGDSVLASQVMIRVQSDLGTEIPMRCFFESPTLRNIAKAIDVRLESSDSNQLSQAQDEEVARLLDEISAMSEEQAQRLLDTEFGDVDQR